MNKPVLTLLFAVVGISYSTVCAPEASAQGFIKRNQGDLPQAHQFYKHRQKWYIEDNSPEIYDRRRRPEPSQQIKVLIPPIPVPQNQNAGSEGEGSGSAGPVVITPVANNLPASRFGSNIPAGGLRTVRQLPSGNSTNLLAGKFQPPARKPASNSSKPKQVTTGQTPAIASYPAFTPAAVTGSSSRTIETSVSGTLKSKGRGHLLHRH